MEQPVPIIEIAFREGMWWRLPASMSKQLYDKYIAGEQVIAYTWDWCPDGENASISRYLLDFECMKQTDIGNNRKFSFPVAWVLPDQIDAVSSGEIPS